MMRKLKFELKHDFKKETEKKPGKKIESENFIGMWKTPRKGVVMKEKLSNLKFELILK